MTTLLPRQRDLADFYVRDEARRELDAATCDASRSAWCVKWAAAALATVDNLHRDLEATLPWDEDAP